MGERGLLVSSKAGRRTFYRLAEGPAWLLSVRTAELLRAGADDTPWDGLWTCVAFSVPNEQRNLRPQLRSQLRELGFAGLYDGLWVCPRPPDQSLDRALDELAEVGAATVLRASIDPEAGGRQPIEAFDLLEVEQAYGRYLDAFALVLARLDDESLPPAEALAARTRASNEWRHLNRLDPDLPAELLPDSWPRRRARQLFVELYDRAAGPAANRFDDVVSAHNPALAGLARHHTTSEPPRPVRA